MDCETIIILIQLSLELANLASHFGCNQAIDVTVFLAMSNGNHIVFHETLLARL